MVPAAQVESHRQAVWLYRGTMISARIEHVQERNSICECTTATRTGGNGGARGLPTNPILILILQYVLNNCFYLLLAELEVLFPPNPGYSSLAAGGATGRAQPVVRPPPPLLITFRA